MVTHYPIILPKSRSDMGKDPVVIAVFASVDDIGKNFVSCFDAFPEESEYAAGHAWVTDDVVGLSNHFRFFEIGYAKEGLIGVYNSPFGVGF